MLFKLWDVLVQGWKFLQPISLNTIWSRCLLIKYSFRPVFNIFEGYLNCLLFPNIHTLFHSSCLLPRFLTKTLFPPPAFGGIVLVYSPSSVLKKLPWFNKNRRLCWNCFVFPVYRFNFEAHAIILCLIFSITILNPFSCNLYLLSNSSFSCSFPFFHLPINHASILPRSFLNLLMLPFTHQDRCWLQYISDVNYISTWYKFENVVDLTGHLLYLNPIKIPHNVGSFPKLTVHNLLHTLTFFI